MSLSQERQSQQEHKVKKPSSVYALYLDHLARVMRVNGMSVLAIMTICVIYQAYIIIKPGFPEIAKQVKAVDLVFLFIGLLSLFFSSIVKYLENNESKYRNLYENRIREIHTLLNGQLGSSLGNTSQSGSEEDTAEGVHNNSDEANRIRRLISGFATKKEVEDFINAGLADTQANTKKSEGEKSNPLNRRINESVFRLKKEIAQLSRRANINLGIGSTVTIAALLSLTYFIVQENFNSIDIKVVALHFIPRLSLVIFIEFFSFFFLKLYRANLQEIQYYQNELTNIETKAVAIELGVNYGDSDAIAILVRDMSSVERNFKLQKGESTVELERSRVETHDLKEVLKAAIGAYQKKK